MAKTIYDAIKDYVDFQGCLKINQSYPNVPITQKTSTPHILNELS